MTRTTKLSQEPSPEMSPLQYAREMDLSLDWVYRQLRLGKIPSRRVDGRWVITKERSYQSGEAA
jgi:hypothetical protein